MLEWVLTAPLGTQSWVLTALENAMRMENNCWTFALVIICLYSTHGFNISYSIKLPGSQTLIVPDLVTRLTMYSSANAFALVSWTLVCTDRFFLSQTTNLLCLLCVSRARPSANRQGPCVIKPPTSPNLTKLAINLS